MEVSMVFRYMVCGLMAVTEYFPHPMPMLTIILEKVA